MEEKDNKIEESWEKPADNNQEPVESPEAEDVIEIEENVEEKPVELTASEEVETEWARTLHIDYDAGEARHRAEAVQERSQSAVPPPIPGAVPPPAPAPQPYNTQTPPKPAGKPAAAYGHPEPMPKTYLIWSILSMVLCCFIPGLVAVIISTSVTTKYYARDYEGARKASERTQYWIIASIVLGVVSATLYLPLTLFVN